MPRWAPFALAQGMVFAFAMLVLARRAAGALERPAPALAACIAVVVASAIASIGGRGFHLPIVHAGRRIVPWIPTLGVLFVATTLAPPWAPASSALWVWPTAVVSETGWLLLVRRWAQSSSGKRQWTSPLTRQHPRRPEQPSADLRQRLVRRAIAADGEAIEGLIAVPIAAGQRWASAHAAFCPPLAQAPQVECRLNDARGLETGVVRAAMVQSFGARFEVKLPGPAPRAQTYWLTFSARAATSPAGASVDAAPSS